ncbi:MAG: CDP-alcohol phosphatidyltransferase family protein [Chloroflexi bacterium]|nr:CDP-alcohol phosphatidyltransferase family protein [Chloroflexota bacterium]
MFPNSASSLARLRRQWQIAVGVGGLVVVAGYFWLRQGDLSPARSLQWAVLAALLLAVEMLVLRRNLHKNRPTPDSPLRSSLGWGNAVTLARGAAYGLMAGFLFAPRPGGLLDWAAAILYSAAIVADYCDGYLARITNHTTLLGEVLDIEFDGLGMLVAMALAVQYGQLPEAVLLLAASRPLFLWGMKLRERWGLPNHPMTPSDERRIAAGLLMGFMGIVLWPVFAPPATHIAGAVFGGAVAASFLRDWLVVIGWLKPTSPAYIRWRARLKTIIFERIPLLLRLASLPAATLLLWSIVRIAGLWTNGLPSAVVPLLIGLGLLAGITALLGVIARLAAIGLVALACADTVVRGDSPEALALLALGVLLVALGNGSPALWTPDERLLRRRAGVRTPAPERPA